jgi:glycosyltransferase involved in cell wall biosynthesis
LTPPPARLESTRKATVSPTPPSPAFDILCFGEDWYKSSYTSTRQIVLRLAAGRRLLWVNPLPVRAPSLAGSAERRAFLRKVAHKLRTHLRLLSRPRPGIWVLSPVYLPLFFSACGDRLNGALLTCQVWLALRLLGFRRPLIWSSSTYHALFVARRLAHHRFFYRFADKNSAFTDLPPAQAERTRALYASYDRAICAEADRIYCASRAIYEDLRAKSGAPAKLVYQPHGVDFAHFHAAAGGGLPVPAALAALPHPVVGYFGSLTNHNDKRILRAIAERHPGWSLVLIGRVMGDYSALADLPNLHLTGAVPYAELPAWAQVFDVAIMNWTLTEWIASSFPVKAQEYLALGLPVVSVRIRELAEQFGDLVRIAEDEEDFVRLVEAELATDSPAKRAARIERVRGRDWSQLAAAVLADAGEDAR